MRWDALAGWLNFHILSLPFAEGPTKPNCH